MSIEPAPLPDRNEQRLQARRSLFGACAIEACRQPQHDALPLCEEHASDVWAELNSRREYAAEHAAAEAKRREWEAERIADLKARIEAKNAGTDRSDAGIIYYLKVADHIKIGYTTNLDVRLRSYPPMARLMATHPGTMQTEASMHELFASDLAGGREWFRTSRGLESHIEVVREKFKQDRRVTA